MVKTLLILLTAIFISSLIFVHSVSAQKLQNLSADDLFNMSFEDLLNVKVEAGNLTGVDNYRVPVSLTSISKFDISITPARNLYDLIEIYVPGAIWMNHHDSPKLGLRGIITDRNYKFLMLVNGINVNNKARNGATIELENWDLSDIERIDIIRGPGSVTYGPGAIAGVINIITKSSLTNKGLDASATRIEPYNSTGFNLGYYNSTGDFDYSLFGSIVSASGWKNTQGIVVMGTDSWGLIKNMGKDYNSQEHSGDNILNYYPQDYFADYESKPQIKINLDLTYLKEINLLGRYTSSGATENGAIPKLTKPTGYDINGKPVGDPYNLKANRYQSLMLALKNEHNFKNLFDLESSVSYSSQNIARRQEYFNFPWQQVVIPDELRNELKDPNSLRNKYVYYAEDVLNFHLLGKKSFTDNLITALGFEYSYNYWGHPWGESSRNFRMGDKGNIISGYDSYCYGYKEFFGVLDSNAFFVGEGWNTRTVSIFGEANWGISNKLNLLLSGRLDKDSYSDHLLSPRAALIYDADSTDILKFIAQQSKRMNTAEELFLQHSSGKISSPESFTGIEIIYTRLFHENYYANISCFYNMVDVLSWFDPERTTKKTGDLKLAGIEFDFRYNTNSINLGFNHSYIKQLEWKLTNGIGTSGISYSDYNAKLDSTFLTGVGNNLNNWSNNTSKLFVNICLFQKTVILHFDTHIFWDFQGAKDGLKMIKNAASGNPQGNKFNELISYLENEKFYDMDFSLNASIVFKYFKNMGLSLFFQNILGLNNNNRYSYEAGYKNQSMIFRGSAIQEPFTIFIKVSTEF